MGEDKPALVIMKGQITPRVNAILEENSIHVCLLPVNTTDLLQPMDLSVDKPVKDFLRRKFQDWYSSQMDQEPDIEAANLEPVDSAMKELGAKWLVETVQHIADNPSFIVNGFIKAGICQALDVENEALACGFRQFFRHGRFRDRRSR